MKVPILLALAVLLLACRQVWATDLATVFGAGVQTCTFSVDKPSIVANGSDAATVTLTVNGMPYTQPISVTNLPTGVVKTGITIPPGGATGLTASAPATFVLMISAPAALSICPQLTIQAHP